MFTVYSHTQAKSMTLSISLPDGTGQLAEQVIEEKDKINWTLSARCMAGYFHSPRV